MKHSIIKSNLSKIIGVAAWLMLWQLVSMLQNNIYIVPSPIETLQALSKLSQQSDFFMSILLTLVRVFVGFTLSVIFGVVTGVLSGINKWVHDFFKPFIAVMRSTPVISIILMIAIWVERGYAPIVIGFLMCFPIIWTTTCEGIQQTDAKLLEMAHCFQVKRKDVILGIYLPAVRPYIISGIMASIGISWKVTVASEVISFPKHSIGKAMYESKIYVETPDLFAWTLVVVALSLLVEYLVKYYLKRMYKRSYSHD